MPDNSSNRATIRASRHSIRAYASFIVPAVLVSGTVSGTPTFPGNNNVVNVTYAVGAHTDVAFGMEVAFFDTATGAFKARTHIRYGASPADANNIFVREFAQATMNLVAGDTFRIYDEFRVHDKLVAATTAFPPDFRFLTTENDEPEPVVNSGGDWAGFVDGYGTASEAAFATVQMTGSTSFTVYPAGGTVNHDWTLPTGVDFQAGSANTDADPILEADAGTHTITHEGEDDASTRTRLSHPSIRVHNDADPPHRVLVTSYEGAADSGWNWEIEVLSGSVTLAALPDGCKCILWTQERYAGVEQSFRNASPGRAHILGVGYVARDTSSGSGEDGVHRLSFEVISPLERLKQIKSYSKVMLEDASPDAWSEIYQLGVLRGILQIVQYYAMWVEAGFDLVVDADFLDERYPAHFLDATNFYDQMMELAKAVDARIVVDRTGRMDMHTHPAYIPLASRAAVTVALEFEDADILDYEWTREHFPKVAQMKVSGISGGATGNAPVFSLYPGNAAGEALDAPEIAKLILDETAPQADVNARAGRYGALADMVFQDEDGIIIKAFDLRLKLRGAYDLFDFYKEYVEVVITGNKRGLDLSGIRFYLLSSSTTFDPDYGTTTTDLVLRMETNAASGETFTPDGEVVTPPDPTPPPPPTNIPPFGLPGGAKDIILLNTDGSAYATGTFNRAAVQGGPVYEAIDPGGAAALATDTPYDWVQDPFLLTRYVVATLGNIYTYDDPTGANTLTLRKALMSSPVFRVIEADFGAGYLWCVTYYGSTPGHEGTYTTYSTDHGVTWTAETLLTAHYHTGLSAVPPVHVSTYEAGVLYTAAFTSTSATPTTSFYRVTPSGATLISTPAGFNPGQLQGWCIHYPFAAGASESSAYFGVYTPTSGTHRKDGNTVTDVSPSVGGAKGRPQYNRAIHTCPVDVNTVLEIATDDSTYNAAFVSRDRGASWTKITDDASSFTFCEVAGNDRNAAYFCGVSGAVGYSGDLVTVDDRMGNLLVLNPSIGRHLRLYGIAQP